MGQPTYITTGFTEQTIYSGLAIIPIDFLGNTVFTGYSISPVIGNGLSFNTTSGAISGIYNGGVSRVSYQVTGTNRFGSISTTFTLNYKGRDLRNRMMDSSVGS